jgi:8-oxo-dGTP pyrophosphatase MutT (NUDIX family)
MTERPSARPVARVLAFDAADRVLLLHGHDPAAPHLGTWWFTPGGGLRPGEDAEAAARRELAEETGLRVGRLLELRSRVAEFRFDGGDHRQAETWWCGRIADSASSPVELTPREQRFLLGSRWWSLDDLTATVETVYPTDLARLVGEALAGSATW